MNTQAARKAARQAAKARAKAEAAELAGHECSIEGCTTGAAIRHECLACEAKKKDDPFAIYGCQKHAQAVTERARKHALTKHPVNLMRGVVRQLAGEDVF